MVERNGDGDRMKREIPTGPSAPLVSSEGERSFKEKWRRS